MIDLELADRELPKILQRRVSCPEIVDRDAKASSPNHPKQTDHVIGRMDERALRQFEFDLARIDVAIGQHLIEQGQEVASL